MCHKKTKQKKTPQNEYGSPTKKKNKTVKKKTPAKLV